MQNKRRVCFAFANGCPRSKASMGLIVEYFRANGWGMTSEFKEADAVVFGCCGFDRYNEEASFKYLSIADRRRKEDAPLIVFGCLSGINSARLKREFDVIPIAPMNIERFDEVTGARVKIKDVKEPNLLGKYEEQFKRCFSFYDHAMVKLQLSNIFRDRVVDRIMLNRGPRPPIESYGEVSEIKVAKGCDGACSYCAIRFAVGRLKSKPVEAVLDEFRAGLDAGNTLFRLIADDVGAYGQDCGGSVAGLLREVFRLDGDYKVMWDDFNPNWLIMYFPELFEIITANADRVAYAGFPMQSGSDRVLRLMNRDYSAADARRCLLKLREAAPSLDLSTHILIGFPGEEDGDFEETVRLMEDVGFIGIQAYAYSDRPNTPSAALPGKVSEDVKARRMREFRRRLASTEAGKKENGLRSFKLSPV